MPTVLITGGTGLIGKHLSKMLADKNYEVIILSREKSNVKLQPKNRNQKTEIRNPHISYAHWDIKKSEIDKNSVAKADYIVHLAGANISEKRWTAKRKKEIEESRTKSAALLIKALNETENNVKAVISASAIGWYGADTNESRQYGFTEETPAAKEFIGETCKRWEEGIEPVQQLKRLVKLRTSIVLSNDGGALPEFKKSLKFGIAAILGSGKQMISWIHIEDICRMYIYVIEHKISGVFNAATSQPVSNKTLVLEMARLMKGKDFIPAHVPSFALKLLLGEMASEVLKSTTVSNAKIKSTGFQFLYPSIKAALESLCKK